MELVAAFCVSTVFGLAVYSKAQRSDESPSPRGVLLDPIACNIQTAHFIILPVAVFRGCAIVSVATAADFTDTVRLCAWISTYSYYTNLYTSCVEWM